MLCVINDINILENSTRFIINHLKDEPNYNYYNDPQQKQQFDHGWNQLIQKQQDYNGPDDLLKRNRERLTYLLNNFHIITPENPYPKFDEEYIFDEHYPRDLFAATQDIYFNISSLTRTILKEGNEEYIPSSKDFIVDLVRKLSSLSWFFSVPMPQRGKVEDFDSKDEHHFKYDNSFVTRDDDSQSKGLPCYMDGGQPVFETRFRYVDKSNFQDMISSEIDLHQFKIDKLYLMDSECIGYYKGITHNKSIYFEQCLVQPVQKLLKGLFQEVVLEKNYDRVETIIPTCSLSINKLGSEFSIPIEFKVRGICDLIEKSKDDCNNHDFNRFLNQIVYQTVYYQSEVGLAIDFDCLFGIDLELKPERVKMGNRNAIKFQPILNCFKQSSSEYSISFLLLYLTTEYFKTITSEHLQPIKEMSDSWDFEYYYDEWL
ncbi:hypothetical protein DFJ63DRAFT_314844 [Scheffersomyces coipomensis]|uniref:uncharacterized protein n=1 Tax=Scheffersomyces coipomensis TaxID=1788519 RepID=UPI00315C663D